MLPEANAAQCCSVGERAAGIAGAAETSRSLQALRSVFCFSGCEAPSLACRIEEGLNSRHLNYGIQEFIIALNPFSGTLRPGPTSSEEWLPVSQIVIFTTFQISDYILLSRYDRSPTTSDFDSLRTLQDDRVMKMILKPRCIRSSEK